MTQLVAWPVDESKRIAHAVNVIERGALEHPFHRARWPIVGDSVAFYTLEANGTNVFGRKNSGGVLWEGQGKRIDTWTATGEPDVVADDLETLFFKHTTHIYVPGEYIPCVAFDGNLYPIGGGREVFSDCMADEDIDGSGNVMIEVSGSQFIVACSAPITDEIVPDGTRVTVRWDHRLREFLIDGTGCPPSN